MKTKIRAIEAAKGWEVWSLDGKTRHGVVVETRLVVDRDPDMDVVRMKVSDGDETKIICFHPYRPILVARPIDQD